MSKVITFSRVFPIYHPKKGEDTFFVEAILNHFGIKFQSEAITPEVAAITNDFYLIDGRHKKGHTIRAGNRWKVGDKFSPRVWSDKAYRSKQIIIAPDIEIKKIWGFKIKDFRIWIVKPNGKWVNIGSTSKEMKQIAENDGLNLFDLWEWFQYPNDFDGQIICWDETIEY